MTPSALRRPLIPAQRGGEPGIGATLLARADRAARLALRRAEEAAAAADAHDRLIRPGTTAAAVHAAESRHLRAMAEFLATEARHHVDAARTIRELLDEGLI